MYKKHASLLIVILTLSNPPSLCTSLNNLKRFKFLYPSTGRLLIGVPIKENTKYIKIILHFFYLKFQKIQIQCKGCVHTHTHTKWDKSSFTVVCIKQFILI